jgi:hypothetical protein
MAEQKAASHLSAVSLNPSPVRLIQTTSLSGLALLEFHGSGDVDL